MKLEFSLASLGLGATFSVAADSQSKVSACLDPGDQLEDPQFWYHRHAEFLFQYAYQQVRDFHLAEDLAHNTLVSGLAAFSGFRGQAAVRSWLTRILINEIAQFKIHKWKQANLRKRIEIRTSDPDVQHDRQYLSERRELREQFWFHVFRGLSQMPAIYAATFRIRYGLNQDFFEASGAVSNWGLPQKKIAEIAERFEVRPSTVSMRLLKARSYLREYLTSVGYDCPMRI
jgi:RNA polymerase sigma factor (sigma-70 family)